MKRKQLLFKILSTIIFLSFFVILWALGTKVIELRMVEKTTSSESFVVNYIAPILFGFAAFAGLVGFFIIISLVFYMLFSMAQTITSIFIKE